MKKSDLPDDCEVCRKSDIEIAGVASSALGACSFRFCHLCLKLHAEPESWIRAVVEVNGGLSNIRDDVELIYYDRKTDTYKNYRNNQIVPIKFKSGDIFYARSKVVEMIRKLSNERD